LHMTAIEIFIRGQLTGGIRTIGPTIQIERDTTSHLSYRKSSGTIRVKVTRDGRKDLLVRPEILGLDRARHVQYPRIGGAQLRWEHRGSTDNVIEEVDHSIVLSQIDVLEHQPKTSAVSQVIGINIFIRTRGRIRSGDRRTGRTRPSHVPDLVESRGETSSRGGDP